LLQVFPKQKVYVCTLFELSYVGQAIISKLKTKFDPSRYVICTGYFSSIKTTVENWTCGLIIQL